MINLLALIPLISAAPAVSAGSSALPAQDFSALLTELVGNVEAQSTPVGPPTLANLPEIAPSAPGASPLHNLRTPFNFETIVPKSPAAPSVPSHTPLSELPIQPSSITIAAKSLLDHIAEAPQASGQEVPAMVPDPKPDSIEMPAPAPPAAAAIASESLLKHIADVLEAQADQLMSMVPSPTPDAILEDLKRLEITIGPDVAKLAETIPNPNPDAILEDVGHPETTTRHDAVKPTEAQIQPELANEITTDPILSVRQRQIPHLWVAIPKLLVERASSDRRNEPVVMQKSDSNTQAPAFQMPDQARTTDSIEQPRPAQYVEIPNVPKLPTVRTVWMEVGDADSQVIVRIEDRGGNMNLHFGAGNESIHHSLESSVGSLIHALKRENIEVTNVEVSRKAPIQKVRRMKEAH